MTENKRYTKEYFDVYNNDYDFIEEDILTIFDNVSNKKYFMEFADDDEKNNTIDELINRLNEQEEEIEYLEKKIKENEWHWNTIDEDRDVWHYKCNQAEEKVKELKDENKQLKQDRFICLDCKYCGYTEIGCLCEKQDHWEDFKNECNNFKELKYYSGDAE